MTLVAFDILAFANKLKGGGMDAKLADIQAEETSKILSNLVTDQLASKEDVNLLKVDMDLVKNDIKLLRGDVNILKSDLTNVKTELMKEIHTQTWKIIGLLAGLQALFHFIK